ncbi:hypothetical protein PV682_15650 [Streptomyces niveiscabiei]|uniref:hypothetical protein n=1 Tax=Streptomyces niveiscabiei TaxID=164115 RepID=UPI0029A193FC|nr:hypothetical protein [Streptomyces niveiscabiei]MDX3382894.1 hypothetical protein [Streptomyces niveiscabiei]
MSDELSRALHELASAHETPPPLPGPAIRARAVRRSRRRTAVALGVTASAVALLAVGLTRGADDPAPRSRPPAAGRTAGPAPAPTAPPSPASSGAPASAVPATGTVDLAGRTLTIGGRRMELASGFDNSPTLKGPLTVGGKPGTKTVTVTNTTDGTRYNAVIAFAVELVDADGRPVYIGASDSYNTEGIGTYEKADGWLALNESDAKWFHGQAELGEALSVER